MARKMTFIIEWVDEGEDSNGYAGFVDKLMALGVDIIDEYEVPMDELESRPRPQKKKGR